MSTKNGEAKIKCHSKRKITTTAPALRSTIECTHHRNVVRSFANGNIYVCVCVYKVWAFLFVSYVSISVRKVDNNSLNSHGLTLLSKRMKQRTSDTKLECGCLVYMVLECSSTITNHLTSSAFTLLTHTHTTNILCERQTILFEALTKWIYFPLSFSFSYAVYLSIIVPLSFPFFPFWPSVISVLLPPNNFLFEWHHK